MPQINFWKNTMLLQNFFLLYADFNFCSLPCKSRHKPAQNLPLFPLLFFTFPLCRHAKITFIQLLAHHFPHFFLFPAFFLWTAQVQRFQGLKKSEKGIKNQQKRINKAAFPHLFPLLIFSFSYTKKQPETQYFKGIEDFGRCRKDWKKNRQPAAADKKSNSHSHPSLSLSSHPFLEIIPILEELKKNEKRHKNR